MDTVEKIWVDEIASNAFSKLKTLVVEYCEKLSSIFSSNTMLIGFQNLEMLTVTDCGFLEVVFHIQDSNMSGNHSASTFRLRELNLERLPKMKHIWSGHPHGTLTFECLQCLKAEKCESLRNLFPSPVAKSMTRLENLEVNDCGVEEIIAEEDEGVGMSVDDLIFPRLMVLILIELPKLRSFYGNSHTSTWPLLKELMVKHCNKIRPISFASEIQSCQDDTTSEDQLALFSFEKRFPNLERLSVVCSSFKEIFSEDVFGHGGVSLKALGNLQQLQLNILHNLRQVWKDGSLMAQILNQIEDLSIWKCSSLSIVFPSPTSFQRLTQLIVEDCPGLVHIGTSLAVTSLVHLTNLILRDCGAMEDVVTYGGNRVEEISFPNLRILALDGLPSLEGFSLANCAFMFPSLVSIFVKQCPKMNIFCQGALRTPKLNKVFLSYEDNEGLWEGDLNTTIQTLLTLTKSTLNSLSQPHLAARSFSGVEDNLDDDNRWPYI
ncbi:hypothetical protein BT93_B1517 [Corymbia citriodora subsp. variegata]|nr:hypothetical protein BT93_B1517 [Corymbia citriodora subsp. variegata]